MSMAVGLGSADFEVGGPCFGLRADCLQDGQQIRQVSLNPKRMKQRLLPWLQDLPNPPHVF